MPILDICSRLAWTHTTLNEKSLESDLRELVRRTVEDTLSDLLKTYELVGAGRYKRAAEREARRPVITTVITTGTRVSPPRHQGPHQDRLLLRRQINPHVLTERLKCAAESE